MDAIESFINFICSPGMVIYTILLGISFVYWCIALFSGLDTDVDLSTESPETSYEFLNFIGVGKVPLSVLLSCIVIPLWVMGYFANSLVYPFLVTVAPIGNFALGIISLLFFLPVCFFIAHFLTKPLSKLYSTQFAVPIKERIINQICIITTQSVTHRSGQAEIVINGDPVILSVKLAPGSSEILLKNENALIVGYDEENHIYTVSTLSPKVKELMSSNPQAHHYKSASHTITE
jgi:hypothetical protein